MNTYGLTPTDSKWYWLQPGETNQNYNQRVAAANSNFPAPGTTSSTGITNTAAVKTAVAPPTQTPTVPTTPAAPPSTTGSATSGASLVDFSTALDKAISIAQQHRAQLLGPLMQGYQGVGTASDFSGILSNLGAASDNFTQRLTKDAMDAAQPAKYNEVSPGATLFDPTTGKAVYTAPTAANQNGFTSGNLNLTPQEKQEVFTILQSGKAADGTQYGNPMGQDGFVDPRVYLKLLDTWKQNGGILEDFLKEYPLSFINPANTWVGAELQARGVKWDPQTTTAADFTDQEKRKLEQAGLQNAPRKQQLDYLYGDAASNPF